MNRHQRRKAQATAERCSSCNEPSPMQLRSPVDDKRRCPRCHDLHLKDVAGPEDTATDMRTVKAQELQEALHQAILRVFPDKQKADVGLIVQCLGTTAATFAVQRHAQHGDLPASGFVRGMAVYVRQIHEALGLPHDLDDLAPPAEAPKIILPS